MKGAVVSPPRVSPVTSVTPVSLYVYSVPPIIG